MQPLSERREIHWVDLIAANISATEDHLHNLLPAGVKDKRQSVTKSNPHMYYNLKLKTNRFKNSPLVYAIIKFV